MSEYEHQQIKELLQKNREVLEENHKILEKLHRAQKWQFWGKIIWLLFIIGVPVWLYFMYIQPTLEPLLEMYQNPTNFSDESIINKLPPEFKKLLDSMR